MVVSILNRFLYFADSTETPSMIKTNIAHFISDLTNCYKE